MTIMGFLIPLSLETAALEFVSAAAIEHFTTSPFWLFALKLTPVTLKKNILKKPACKFYAQRD
jgi:hypothetical protein